MQRLRVSSNGRYLVQGNGTPFLWIGDTAWRMVHTLGREDLDLYLDNRQAKGFSVIQAVAFTSSGASAGQRRNPTNAYGHRPFVGGDSPDPARPRVMSSGSMTGPNDYWDHLDYIVRATESRGLYMALLPCWGSGHVNGRGSAADAVVFDTISAKAYGTFLGERYGKEAHIIWVLGGDVGAQEPTDKRPVYRAMAEGLVKGATGHAVSWDQPHQAWDDLLMTYHPRGVQSSSQWFHDDAWLDFNMIQTYKHRDRVRYMVDRDYQLANPVKPTIMGEPAYEGYGGHSKVISHALQVRRQAYQSFFSGAAGFTYGCAMSAPDGDGPLFGFGPGWTHLLDLPGAHNVALELSALLSGREWWKLIPDQALIAEDQGGGEMTKAAARSSDGNELLVYYADHSPASIRLDGIVTGGPATVTWFDPRSAATQLAGTIATRGTQRFAPPDRWEDAVLVIAAE